MNRASPIECSGSGIVSERGSPNAVAASENATPWEHLGCWTERNTTLGGQPQDAFEERDILDDLDATKRVARWAYTQAERAGGQVWVTKAELRELGRGWREAFGEVRQ